eukprot:m.558 g.558  ORF g.558 m.558 type:complete len:50 (-) comp513_c0_seq1:319-468(-)
MDPQQSPSVHQQATIKINSARNGAMAKTATTVIHKVTTVEIPHHKCHTH